MGFRHGRQADRADRRGNRLRWSIDAQRLSLGTSLRSQKTSNWAFKRGISKISRVVGSIIILERIVMAKKIS